MSVNRLKHLQFEKNQNNEYRKRQKIYLDEEEKKYKDKAAETRRKLKNDMKESTQQLSEKKALQNKEEYFSY